MANIKKGILGNVTGAIGTISAHTIKDKNVITTRRKPSNTGNTINCVSAKGQLASFEASLKNMIKILKQDFNMYKNIVFKDIGEQFAYNLSKFKKVKVGVYKAHPMRLNAGFLRSYLRVNFVEDEKKFNLTYDFRSNVNMDYSQIILVYCAFNTVSKRLVTIYFQDVGGFGNREGSYSGFAYDKQFLVHVFAYVKDANIATVTKSYFVQS